MKAPAKSARIMLGALLLLSAIPALAGMFRLFQLTSGATVTPDNARFFAAPLPVALHIVGVVLFTVLGAFQVIPGFGLRNLKRHRIAGRILIPAGLVASLTGVWMTEYHPLSAAMQGPFLYWVRYLVGGSMTAWIVLSLIAIRSPNIRAHRAGIIRAYALGQGAGTQAFILVPWTLARGEPLGLARDLLMTLAWVINLGVAEWIIRKKR